ncbi:MAG TPA: hypothetical protein VGK73_33940 [Polyangiaceae bacterium]
MTTNHTGDGSGGFDNVYPLMVDSDSPNALLFRVPFEQLANNLDNVRTTPVQRPESYAEIRDDFIGCVFDSTTDVLHSALPWQVTSTENAVPGTDAANGHPGTVTASLLATEEFEMELAGEQNNIRWGNLQDATFAVRMTSTDFTDAELFVGLAENFELASVGNNAVGLWFEHGTESDQWLIRHKVGGVDDATITAKFVGSTIWATLKLRRISATQVEVYLFDDLVATLTDGVDAPADSALLTVGMIAKAGSAAAMTPALDLVYVRWDLPR